MNLFFACGAETLFMQISGMTRNQCWVSDFTEQNNSWKYSGNEDSIPENKMTFPCNEIDGVGRRRFPSLTVTYRNDPDGVVVVSLCWWSITFVFIVAFYLWSKICWKFEKLFNEICEFLDVITSTILRRYFLISLLDCSVKSCSLQLHMYLQ